MIKLGTTVKDKYSNFTGTVVGKANWVGREQDEWYVQPLGSDSKLENAISFPGARLEEIELVVKDPVEHNATVKLALPAETTEAPAKRGRPRKEAASETETEDAQEELDLGDQEPEIAELTLDDVRRACKANPKRSNEILIKKYKVKKLSDLPTEKYAEVIAALKA